MARRRLLHRLHLHGHHVVAAVAVDELVERIDARAANSIYGPMLERLSAETGVPIVPARQIFCEGGQCSMVRDGGMQFRDSNHLSIAGSERLGRIVADLVRDALS